MSLPSGYTRLEYIESTGTQYIDTGFKPTSQKVRLVGRLAFKDASGVQSPFGAQTNSAWMLMLWTNGAALYANCGLSNSFALGSIPTAGTVADYDLTANNGALALTIGGATHTFSYTSPLLASLPFLLFACNTNGAAGSHARLRLESFKIYDNDALVRDFIPCKNASGVIGLWDDANSVFYSNAGSGTFTAGAEIIAKQKTLINSVSYDVKAGVPLVNGVTYRIKKGRTLVDGTGYDITFEKKLRVAITGTGNETYAYVTINGIKYTGPATVEVEEDAQINCHTKNSYPMSGTGIFFNGEIAQAASTSGDYSADLTFTIASDISIELAYGTVGPGYLSGNIYVTF